MASPRYRKTYSPFHLKSKYEWVLLKRTRDLDDKNMVWHIQEYEDTPFCDYAQNYQDAEVTKHEEDTLTPPNGGKLCEKCRDTYILNVIEMLMSDYVKLTGDYVGLAERLEKLKK